MGPVGRRLRGRGDRVFVHPRGRRRGRSSPWAGSHAAALIGGLVDTRRVSDDFDLVVLGAGPAGEKGAAQAAYFGKRVAIVEREPMPGGAGINTGTVPSKTLRETALYFSGLGQRGLYGVDYHVKAHPTVKDLMYREQEGVRSLRQVVTENIVRHKIDLLRGQASFDDPHTVRVTKDGEPDRRLQAEAVPVT